LSDLTGDWYETQRRDREVKALENIARSLNDIRHILFEALIPKKPEAVALTLSLKVGNMPTTSFTVDQEGNIAVQFTDDHGDPTTGPNDSVTGTPIVPVVSTDNTAVCIPSGLVAGTTAGSFTGEANPVAEGSCNFSIVTLTNSDGSAVTDSAGNPFALPPAVAVTVTAGDAAALSLSVSGPTTVSAGSSETPVASTEEPSDASTSSTDDSTSTPTSTTPSSDPVSDVLGTPADPTAAPVEPTPDVTPA
jgi:hypothetical protein